MAARGIEFTLSEVKGPVMDRLRSTELSQGLQGKVLQPNARAFQKHASSRRGR